MSQRRDPRYTLSLPPRPEHPTPADYDLEEVVVVVKDFRIEEVSMTHGDGRPVLLATANRRLCWATQSKTGVGKGHETVR